MNASSTQAQWQQVYAARLAVETSWFAEHLHDSLRLIDGLGLDRSAPVIDVGGGRSTLADDLLSRGYDDITVLDLSSTALDELQARVRATAGTGAGGSDASRSLRNIAGDMLAVDLPRQHFALWHDRAAFHFLTDPAQRQRYVEQATRSLRTGGFLIVATFAQSGPERCSGLPVARYDPQALAACFAPAFEAVDALETMHRTPAGSEQPFTYALLRRGACAPAGAAETSTDAGVTLVPATE